MRNNEKLHIIKHVRYRESDRTGEESFMKYDLEHYGQYLTECEKSKNTIEKYLRDVRAFLIFSGERELSKEIILDYKKLLIEKYRTSSVNSMLIAVNGYLSWIGRDDLRVRVCRTQRRIFREEERELTREEYQRLLMTARRENRERLFCILQTIAGTGMRIGELKYLTAETLEERKIRIDFKGQSSDHPDPKVPSDPFERLLSKTEDQGGKYFSAQGTGDRWTGEIYGRR